jgi:hypothetical protein
MKTSLSIIGILVVVLMLFAGFNTTNVSAAGSSYRFSITEIGYGRIVSIDAVNDSVVYSGNELIVKVSIYDNRTVINSVILGNSTFSQVYVDSNVGLNTTVYIYNVRFDSDGETSILLYLSDGSAAQVVFFVSSSEYTFIDDETLANYTEMYNYAQERTDEVSQLMNAEYLDNPSGYNDAWLDVIDDSRALREGPVYFGANMLLGLLMIFISPYSIIWVVLIIAAVLYSKRNIALAVEKMDKEREEFSLDTASLAVASKMQQERSRSLMGSTKRVASYLGIPAQIWKDIHRDYPTIGSVCGGFDDTKFLDDGSMDGPIAISLATWIRSSLTTHGTSTGSSSIRIDPRRDYVNALRNILDYVVTELHFNNYQIYIKKLEKTDDFINMIVQKVGPLTGGLDTDLPENAMNKLDNAELDFRDLLDSIDGRRN